MLGKALRKIEYIIMTAKIFNRDAYREEWFELAGKCPARDNKFHLVEAIEWIKRAQDVNADGGVARGYSITWNPYFRSKGWQPSYPETTGYIIPTFFESAKYFSDKDLYRRAVKMAEWEVNVQMKNGAVRGGTISEGDPVPSVFCTGQVIFGLVRAYEETKSKAFFEAAKKAGDYLLSVQDNEGRLQEDSRYNFANRESTVYHTRVAWSLAMLGRVTNNKEYTEAGVKNIEYNLRYQDNNGWFSNNCIYNPAEPLLHTICYAIRGILETGVLLGEEKFIKAAKLASDNLLSINEDPEYLPGRFDKNWKGTVTWSCLTGDAQLAIIFLRLYQITKDSRYLKGAQKLIGFVKTKQNCQTSNQGIRGGIKGSHPVGAGYGSFQILNWATKFFIDALLLENMIKEDKRYQTYG